MHKREQIFTFIWFEFSHIGFPCGWWDTYESVGGYGRNVLHVTCRRQACRWHWPDVCVIFNSSLHDLHSEIHDLHSEIHCWIDDGNTSAPIWLQLGLLHLLRSFVDMVSDLMQYTKGFDLSILANITETVSHSEWTCHESEIAPLRIVKICIVKRRQLKQLTFRCILYCHNMRNLFQKISKLSVCFLTACT